MSSASVTTTPVNPIRPRSRSRRIAGERSAGRTSPSGSSAGYALWDTMTSLAPALTAFRNGASSRDSRVAASAVTIGRPWCGSASVSPLPGKCLTTPATPLDWSPSTKAAPSTPAMSGSSPNARVPTAGLAGVVARSRSGAQSTLTPMAPSSRPIAAPTRRARSGSPAAPMARGPGNCVAGAPMPMSWPPSWSMATMGAGCPPSTAAVRRASDSCRSCEGERTLRPRYSATPAASPDRIAARTSGGGTSPSNARRSGTAGPALATPTP
jgi:hypothetical protein